MLSKLGNSIGSRFPFYRLALPLAILGFLAGHGHAQDWRKQEYRADGFAVEFFGEVKITPTEVAADAKERITRSTNYLQDEGSSAFIVGATLAKHAVDFDNGVQASFAALKCQTTVSDQRLNFPRGQAREISGSACTQDGSLAVETRYYAVGKWFYQVMAIYPKGGSQATPRRFIQSFAVLE